MGFWICSARGRCWSSVPDHGATTHVLPRTLKPTMRACNRPCRARPSLAKSKFGQTKFGHQVWPDQVWPRPSLARPSAGQSILSVFCVKASLSDERSIKVLASGLPAHHGAQLAVDITLRSALTAQGEARPNAAHVNGAVLAAARRDKAWWAWRPAAVGVKRRWVSSKCSQEPERAMLHRP